MGYLAQKVLQILCFRTKCPQAPLAQLAAFSRSGRQAVMLILVPKARKLPPQIVADPSASKHHSRDWTCKSESSQCICSLNFSPVIMRNPVFSLPMVFLILFEVNLVILLINAIFIYRVSHNIVSTFVLLNSRPLKHLEVPSWTFFNSPFRVDFKTIQFVIIWWNLDRDIDKILEESHFKS